MYSVLLIIIVILALILCFLVTIQNSKGGGLAAGFASSNQIMGVRKTTDFLEKSTWTVMASIVVLSIITAFEAKPKAVDQESVMMKSAAEQMSVNPETAPAFDASSELEIPVATETEGEAAE